MGMNVLTSISPGQLLTKITNDELTQLMGGESTDINVQGNPAVILIAGLQGSGKTTFSGKLASRLQATSSTWSEAGRFFGRLLKFRLRPLKSNGLLGSAASSHSFILATAVSRFSPGA